MCVRVRSLAVRFVASGRGGIETPRPSERFEKMTKYKVVPKNFSPGTARGRAKGLEASRRTKRGLQVVEEESVVFSNIEVRV